MPLNIIKEDSYDEIKEIWNDVSRFDKEKLLKNIKVDIDFDESKTGDKTSIDINIDFFDMGETLIIIPSDAINTPVIQEYE